MVFYWFGASIYESMSLRTWLERCESANLIYDLGAFSGVYALSAAVKNSKSMIIAFEAVRHTYAKRSPSSIPRNLRTFSYCIFSNSPAFRHFVALSAAFSASFGLFRMLRDDMFTQ